MLSSLGSLHLHQQAGPASVQQPRCCWETCCFPAGPVCHFVSALREVLQDGNWKWQGPTPVGLELEALCHFCPFKNCVLAELSFLSRHCSVYVWNPRFPEESALHIFHACEPGNYMVPLTCSSKNEGGRFSFSIAPYFFSLNTQGALKSNKINSFFPLPLSWLATIGFAHEMPRTIYKSWHRNMQLE